MDILRQHLERAAEIIGDRTPGEVRYDREVVRWLERGKPLQKALARASRKYPEEALQVDEAGLADVEAHYDYLMKHERILRTLKSRGR